MPPAPPSNPTGKSRASRVATTSLALAIRRLQSPEETYWWLRCVAAGYDPDAIQPDSRRLWQVCAATGELARPAATPAGYVAPDYQHRLAAAKMILDRAYGQPAQHVVLEAEVRAAHVHAVAAGDPVMARLTEAQLEALASVTRAAEELAGDEVGLLSE